MTELSPVFSAHAQLAAELKEAPKAEICMIPRKFLDIILTEWEDRHK